VRLLGPSRPCRRCDQHGTCKCDRDERRQRHDHLTHHFFLSSAPAGGGASAPGNMASPPSPEQLHTVVPLDAVAAVPEHPEGTGASLRKCCGAAPCGVVSMHQVRPTPKKYIDAKGLAGRGDLAGSGALGFAAPSRSSPLLVRRPELSIPADSQCRSRTSR
jgi:hypothetical protein